MMTTAYRKCGGNTVMVSIITMKATMIITKTAAKATITMLTYRNNVLTTGRALLLLLCDVNGATLGYNEWNLTYYESPL